MQASLPKGASVAAYSVVRKFPGSGLVVDHVDLQITSGEIVAILGPSGCGKSTFLRMIAGLDRPDSGNLSVDSQRNKFYRSFVFQDAHLIPWRTVCQNISLPLELMGVPKKDALARARKQAHRVNLSDAEDRYPHELSGGMKMRTSLARALVTEPTLLLLDEPLSSLDENTRHTLQNEIRRVWETTPLTVIFVTHSIREAVFLGNRAIVFSKRPARTLLDTAIDLPNRRPPEIRNDPSFQEEVNKIYRAVPVSESPL